MSLNEMSTRTLLVVEDQRDLREILVEMIEELGYKCLGAPNGKEALRILEAEEVHAVLCDIMMPIMTGTELLEEMRGKGIDIPFVFLTGYSDPENLLTAVRLGAFHFIEKPFDVEKLSIIVQRAMDVGMRAQNLKETLIKMKNLYPQMIQEIDRLEKDVLQIERLRAAK